jgi:hypothetical protein
MASSKFSRKFRRDFVFLSPVCVVDFRPT